MSSYLVTSFCSQRGSKMAKKIVVILNVWPISRNPADILLSSHSYLNWISTFFSHFINWARIILYIDCKNIFHECNSIIVSSVCLLVQAYPQDFLNEGRLRSLPRDLIQCFCSGHTHECNRQTMRSVKKHSLGSEKNIFGFYSLILTQLHWRCVLNSY